jgi:hypothetical protein
MRSRSARLLLVLLLAGVGDLAAQQSVAFTPFIGLMHPMQDLVVPATPTQYLRVTAKDGIQVGATAELNMSKHLAFTGFAASTIGLTQKATFHDIPTNSLVEQGMASTQVGATLMLRPLGRNANGSPNLFYVEGGAAYNMFSFAEIQDRNNPTQTSSWNASSLMGIIGGGLTFRVGRSATMVLFARYHLALKAYDSPGLTDWNSPCAPGDATCIDRAQKVNLLLVGAGLRTGR